MIKRFRISLPCDHVLQKTVTLSELGRFRSWSCNEGKKKNILLNLLLFCRYVVVVAFAFKNSLKLPTISEPKGPFLSYSSFVSTPEMFIVLHLYLSVRYNLGIVLKQGLPHSNANISIHIHHVF